jgi:hypothetical protein
MNNGSPVFWLGEQVEDVYLHPIDTAQPLKFYFDLFDAKPGDLKPAAPEDPNPATWPEDLRLDGVRLADLKLKDLRPGDLEMLVKKLGRRAVFNILQKSNVNDRT